MTPGHPKVLTLMASFNGARWITDQVDSILQQVNVEAHLVISDDGSTDDTWQRLQTRVAAERVRLLASPAPTGSAAQNFFSLIRANSAADCDFVALSDQDDLWEPDKLWR